MQENFNPNNIILAIDIGSSKIHTLIAERTAGAPRLMGWGVCESQGVQKGIITNIEQVSADLQIALEKATNMAGVKAKKATVSISGAYVEYTKTSAVVNIAAERGEIQLKDIERLMKNCVYNARLERNYIAIHVLPYKFVVKDYNVPIEDPLSMNAENMECFAYVVMAKRAVVETLKKVLTNCEIEVEDIVLSSYASSIAALTPEERRQGVVCIDMGAQTCDMMMYSGASMCYGNYFPVGSAHITSDIAQVLGVTREVAEKLKVEYVDMIVQEGDAQRGLNISRKDAENKLIPVTTLHKIAEARVRETFEVLGDIIERSEMRDQIGGGLVITGGMTKLKNLEQYLHQENIMHPLPVRIGTPAGIDGAFDILKDLEMATAVGLVLYAAGHFTNYELTMQNTIKVRKNHGVQKAASNLPAYNNHQEGNVQDLQIKKQVLPPRAKQKTQSADVEADHTEAGGDNPIRRFWRWLSQLF
ncbi:cell division protein FtsA [uncultured Helicobacter sp.]|uniref:cell division protein FtsA n=1 Tax=uncultured Helicobacter sp. TaxID=175537 RepID=UPI003752D896